MAPLAHPAPELLLSFATGRADLPHRVLLEAHLAGCPDCRAALAETANPGGALLRGLPGAPLPAALWERLRQRVAAEPLPARREVPAALAGLPLPEAARDELPAIRRLRWHWGFARGARMAGLARDPDTRSVLVIGHIPPRRAFPRHLHVGPEDLLVLTGGYEDEMGHWEAGAYAAYEPGTIHRPVIEPGETCWILLRLEAPNRLLGWQGWVQRLLS
jgi:putative transcriptional regulator